jgi:hypothetical protein
MSITRVFFGYENNNTNSKSAGTRRFLQQHQQQWRSLREIKYQMNNILITSAGKRVSLINAFKRIESYFS